MAVMEAVIKVVVGTGVDVENASPRHCGRRGIL
jgi:hypothetical protein